MSFKVGHIPQRQGNKQIRADLTWLRERNMAFFGMSEMDLSHKELYDVLRDDYFIKTKSGRYIGEVPVMVSKDRVEKILVNELIKLSNGQPGSKISHPRYLNIVGWLTTDGRKEMYLYTHWDAVLNDRETGRLFAETRRVIMMRRAGKILEREIKRYKKQNFNVNVGGDFNYRSRYNVPGFILWYWSPQRIFTRTKLKWEENGLDYLAYDGTKVTLVDLKKYPPNSPGNNGDHSYMIAEYVYKKDNR